MSKIKFSVTRNGKALDESLYTWDEETKTFSTLENDLILDFSNVDNCTFKTGYGCTFDTGSGCTFKTGDDCTFDTGYDCTFKTSGNCTFDTGDDCTFKTGSGCTFKTGDDCTFDTGSNCTFKTGYGCTFDTGYGCTFDTGYGCTFDTGYDCTFKTGYGCVLVRRDVFEFYNISDKQLTTAPYKIKGYIENGYYYVDGYIQYKAIISDGILSEVLTQRNNVYKVKNYGEEKISYIVKDGDIYSHGATLKEAKESLIYKISNRDTSMYDNYTFDTVLTFEEAIKMYRVITGACEAGTRYFVEQNQNKKKDKYTVEEIIKLTQGQYNHNKLVEFFERR